ncbi:MAG: hypothetical protein ACUVS3_12790 [Thermodesulfobacteriota bacterium]
MKSRNNGTGSPLYGRRFARSFDRIAEIPKGFKNPKGDLSPLKLVDLATAASLWYYPAPGIVMGR